MPALNETLLDCWIDLSLAIINEKVVSELPYNEALICNILSRYERSNPPAPLTATALCEQTRMQKSQMNRTLTSMENRGLITRERSREDKRQVFIRLNPSQDGAYQAQHQRILAMVDEVISQVGEEKAQQIVDTLHTIVQAATEVFK